MTVQFKNNKEETFLLGTVTFNSLDKNNIFDPYQEDNDYYSDVLFKTSKPKQLAQDIRIWVENNSISYMRGTILKINNFIDFLEQSEGIEASLQ